jgi:hypothetical protein
MRMTCPNDLTVLQSMLRFFTVFTRSFEESNDLTVQVLQYYNILLK